jgi:hypothetical protein
MRLGAMSATGSKTDTFFQLQDVCRLLDVGYRDARYLCEKNWLPRGVAREPGRGNHRQLTAAQAVRLGIILKLKACGMHAPMAAKIADFAERIRGLTRNLVWDWQFSPFDGALDTEHRWYIEVGDMRFVRFVTDANPSKVGLHEMDWVDIATRKDAKDATPIVCVRVDISALARLLNSRPRS